MVCYCVHVHLAIASTFIRFMPHFPFAAHVCLARRSTPRRRTDVKSFFRPLSKAFSSTQSSSSPRTFPLLHLASSSLIFQLAEPRNLTTPSPSPLRVVGTAGQAKVPDANAHLAFGCCGKDKGKVFRKRHALVIRVERKKAELGWIRSISRLPPLVARERTRFFHGLECEVITKVFRRGLRR